MRTMHVLCCSAVAALLGCSEPQSTLGPTEFEASFSMHAASSSPDHFNAHLSGAEEVPSRDTRAQGQAKFTLDPSGEVIRYRLIVSNIENVVAAHIHRGAAGVNGPPVVWLYGPAAAAGGPTQGPLAEGIITAADLIGPLAGQPLSALLDAIRAGNTYVNVHTNDGAGDSNTGPGDFPGGEVRGQIRALDRR